MRSTENGGHRPPTNARPTGSPARRAARWSRHSILLALVLGGLAVSSTNALADGSVTLPGGPLTVSVGSLGECQSSYANAGVNFFPPFGTVGDCGFFLSFPTAGSGQPTPLKEKVYGFSGSAGPGLSTVYTAIAQGAPTGSGTTADPYSEVTTFKVRASDSKDYALITLTTTYIAGQPQFTSTYDVQNITGSIGTGGLEPATATTLYFHAIVAGDLFVNNDDRGTGVDLAGPPRFIGGQNNTTGVLGGFIEAAAPALPWTNFQEGYWDGPEPPEPRIPQNNGIWNAVRTSATSLPVFNETIDPNLMDNGAGVSWDQFLTTGLPAGQHATFSIVNRAQVPTTLNVQPVNQTLTAGATATIKVTALDTAGNPYAGRPLVYSIGGSNARSGSVTTDSAGVATISYVGTNVGLDTIQMFLDLVGNGSQASQDPASSAQVTWNPVPPTPNSTYTVQSIKSNPDGTITITFVPSQSGAASLTVTVPTGTIARKNAIAAKKAKKCKKGLTRIKRKCRPKVTVTGTTKAGGTAGVPLTLAVKPSSKIKALLKKGKTVHLTATLTYTSALGGAPTVHVYKVTLKGKKAKHKKHRK